MSVYYIDPGGNDTTGNGSSGSPWQSFTKAIATVTNGDVVNVNNGVYQENTSGVGYWSISKNASDWITFQATSGSSGSVVVKASGSGIQNTLFAGTSSYLRFIDIQFGALNATRYCVRINGSASFLDFLRCTLIHDLDFETFYINSANLGISNITFTDCTLKTTGNTYVIRIEPTGTGSALFTFDNCTVSGSVNRLLSFNNSTININNGNWTLTSGTTAQAFRGTNSTITCNNTDIISSATTGATIYCTGNLTNKYTLINCNVIQNGGGIPVSIDSGSITIQNGIYTTIGNAKVLSLGTDAVSGCPVWVDILDAEVMKVSGTNHAAMIGAGATGIINGIKIKNPSGDYGLVVKENSNAKVINSDIDSGTIAALYFKGAKSASANNNKLNGINGGYAFQMVVGDTGNTSASCNITGNIMKASGSSKLLNWVSTGDGGSNIMNQNKYKVYGSGNFGNVRSTSNITSMSALRFAWNDYTNPTNDFNSSILVQESNKVFKYIFLRR